MSTTRRPKSRRAAAPQQGGPIRIVPLFGHPAPGAAAAVQARAPALTYRGGPLLTAAQLYTLYWGVAWRDAAQQTTLKALNAFAGFIVSSSYLDQLAEYGVSGQAIGRGRFVATLTAPDTSLGASVSDAAVQRMLDAQIIAKTLPPPTVNSLYFVFVPPGVAVVAGGDRSCKVFCGYHDRSTSGLYYAVVPAPDCAGCLGGLQPLDALTSVASHELAEAITDPVPGQGWYDDASGEIGDICAWENESLGGYVVQKLWSNAASACV